MSISIKELLRTPMAEASNYTPGGKPLPPVPEGITKCTLNSNENQLGPSPLVVEALKDQLTSMHLYPFETITPAREAIADYHQVGVDQVVMTSGSMALICALGDLFLNVDDEVVICSPSYMAYYLVPKRYGAKIVEVDNKDYASDVYAMVEAMNDKTKMAIIVNPNNPTGAKVSNEDMRYFIENTPEHVIIVIDEAYIDWVDDVHHESMIQYTRDHKNVIVLRTFSKLYGLAGLRAGYAITSPEIYSHLVNLEFNYSPSRLVLSTIPTILNDEEYKKKSILNNTTGRKYLMKEMRKLGFDVVESYTSFIYFDPHMDCEQLLLDLNARGCIIRPFGDRLRISVGLPEQNEQFINALKDILGR